MKAHICTVQNLRRRDYRRQSGCVIVEGYREIRRALDAGVPVETLYLCREIFQPANGEFDRLPVVEVSKDTFKQMAFGHRLKGVLAICKPFPLSLNDLKPAKKPLLIVVENVEKPGNLGTIIRSCDGCGVDAVIYCDMKMDLYNQHVVRSSIGTVFHVPCVRASKEDTAEFLSRREIAVVVSSARAETDYTEYDFRLPSAVVIGNEHEGVSPFWKTQAVREVRIPMAGAGSSLNAAVSAAVLMYEAQRQRQS